MCDGGEVLTLKGDAVYANYRLDRGVGDVEV